MTRVSTAMPVRKVEGRADLDGLRVWTAKIESVAPRERRDEERDAPAVMTMNSQIPRLRVLVASLAPFLSCVRREGAGQPPRREKNCRAPLEKERTCLKWDACWTRSRIWFVRLASARGNACERGESLLEQIESKTDGALWGWWRPCFKRVPAESLGVQ